MREFFRGIIWPRTTNFPVHKYVIIGMLVTDKPIEEFKDSQYILNGNAYGLSDTIAGIKAIQSNVALGTADDVLLNLGQLVEMVTPNDS